MGAIVSEYYTPVGRVIIIIGKMIMEECPPLWTSCGGSTLVLRKFLGVGDVEDG